MQNFVIAATDNGKRIDVYLASIMPGYSRSVLAKLFDGRILVNGKAIRSSHKLKDGDKLSIDTKSLTIKPPKIDLPIIYEDENIIVIDKPAGLLTHSKGSLNQESTVASFIEPFYKLEKSELKTNKSGIVHRLDRDTSGVIVTAKNLKTHHLLQNQFSSRKVKKIYIALVTGELQPQEAIIDAPIGRNPKSPQKFHVTPTGKSAQTHYRVLSSTSGYSLVELSPTTGRTHQLRVHLSYLEHPIVGDRFYGQLGDRLALHATTIGLDVPGVGKQEFSSPAPNFINNQQK